MTAENDARNVPQAVTRPLLRVTPPTTMGGRIFGADEFDEPKAIALAAEGFCPYHWTEAEPVPLERLADGRVKCVREGGHLMTLEFTEEEVWP